MAVEPRDFLGLAQDACRDDSPEIARRNAISRSYYGAFHAARQAAQRLDWPEYANGGTHSRLASLFENRQKKSVAYRLRALHRMRCAADYDLATEISAAQTIEHVAKAGQLFCELQDMAGD